MFKKLTTTVQDDEQARIESIVSLLPRGRRTVLDVGVHDCRVTRLLPAYFNEVVALDLEKPAIVHDRIKCIKGNVTALHFEDDAFDTVLCTEVLEHVPNLEAACRELVRVARHEVIIGVPYRQETRISQTTCLSCGKINPSWGHVNIFDEARLVQLFAPLKIDRKEFVCSNRERTNCLAVALMNWAGNPWGSYDQAFPCVHCGCTLRPPVRRSLGKRACGAIAFAMNVVQQRFSREEPSWIHVVFKKVSPCVIIAAPDAEKLNKRRTS